MEMKILFPGNKRVVAQFDGFEVATDQPPPSGDGSAPAPFDLFLASIGTCAGIYVVSFCQKRNLPTEGLEIRQKVEWDETETRVARISLEILVPKTFPEHYRASLINAANLCTVKKHLATPPEFQIATRTAPETEAQLN